MSSKEKNEELVTLSFNNTQGGSNWTEFCRLQSRYQIAKYGDFGRFMLDGKHYEEARIQKPVRGEGVDDEEWEIVLSEYKDARKRQNKSAYARLLLRSASYAELMTHISQQIKDLLERDLTWDDKTSSDGTVVVGVNTEMDPLRLLTLAKKVVGTGLYGSMATDKYTVMSRYQACRQGNVALAEYQRIFKDQLSYLRAVGYTEVMVPESDVAMQYIQSLNSQFQGWRDELAKLTLALKESKYPSTLAEAMEMSVSYSKIVSGSAVSKAAGKPVFALEEAGGEEEPEFCMVMGPNPKFKPKKGGHGDKADAAKAEPVTVKVPKEVIESQKVREGDTRACRSCGVVGHIWKQCAVRIFKEEQKKAHGPDTIFCMGASVVGWKTAEDADESDEEDYHVGGYRRSEEMLRLTRTAVRAAGDMHLSMTPGMSEVGLGGRQREETLKVFAAAKMGPNMAGLDTMSALCGTANRNLVKGIRSGRNLQLFGIGGVCDVTEAGRLLDTEIDMWVFLEGYPTILCFHDIWSKYGIEFDSLKNQFDTTIMGVELHFKPCETDEKVYMADISELIFKCENRSSGIWSTEIVARRKELYTKAEVKAADMALDLSRKLCDPSDASLIKTLSSGGILECPITARDLRRARDIYGPSLSATRGKAKRTQSNRVWEPERVDRLGPCEVSIWVDIMFVDGMPALISVSGAMRYLQVTWLKGRDYENVRAHLKKHIERLTREGFKVTGLHADGEGAIAKAKDDLPVGCVFNARTKGQHVNEIEVQIRTVKERTRGILATLPFRLTKILLMWLVLFVVSRLNLVGNSVTSEFISPAEAVYGRKANYKTDLALNFGDYCELHEFDEVTNTMRPRTVAALALMSTGNAQGSWWFLKLNTGKTVRRDRWIEMRLTDEMIQKLNTMADSSGSSANRAEFLYDGELIADGTRDGEGQQLDTFGHGEFSNGGVAVESLSDDAAAAELGVSDDPPVVEPRAARTFEEATAPLGMELDVRPSQFDITAEEEVHEEPLLLHSIDEEMEQSADYPEPEVEVPFRVHNTRGVRYDGLSWRDRKEAEAASEGRLYGMRIGVSDAIARLGTLATDSITKELVGLHEAGSLGKVRRSELSYKQRKKMIRSMMFLKEKHLPSGEFDKLKARLVAGGHMQDRMEYTSKDTSSPTVSLSAVYMVAGIAAREERVVATADVGMAFLKADLHREIIMSLEPKLAKMMCKVLPEYEDYINEDGTLCVILKKALYGLVESSKLWFDELSGFLTSVGFIANKKDRCVFNKMHAEDQITVCCYVDDLMVTCKNEEGVNWILQRVKEKFKDLTINRGVVHSYLGQTFDFGIRGEVKITMAGYVADLLLLRPITRGAVTPALENLFTVDDDAVKLEKDAAEVFHSTVMKLQYLAKRVRPDILTATVFLNSRVLCPDVDDDKKLERVLRYLLATESLGIRLGGNAGTVSPPEVTAYVDASYGVHADYKSQTGQVVTIDGGPVHVHAGKQRLNSKSSTEAELIGLSDSTSQIIWTRDFLLEQGYDVKPAKIMQDNQSCMVLANRGFSTSEKSRHIAIRYFWVTDRIESGEVLLEYLRTEDMMADIMTKPLQGALFRKMRSLLLNLE